MSTPAKTVSRKWYPVRFTQVTVDDAFWSPRIQINRDVTLPFQYKQCEETGRIDAFRLNWKPGQDRKPHIFWDSDVAKWIEAASYRLASTPDVQLDRLVDETIELIAAAQQPDGYLNTFFTAVQPEGRWQDLSMNHELYCAGHLMEAAVAHYEATGKTKMLNVMCRYADYIGEVFGTGEGQLRGYCGHEEIELALVKLYRATGKENYLRLAQYFIDERGQEPHYFDMELAIRGGEKHKLFNNYNYAQAHIPVREQTEVVGHAVRAMYLYCAMADLAGELGDATLLQACETIWNNLYKKKLYLTGGIGSSRHNEGFSQDYDLPNDTAYAETCAAVGYVLWNHRMLQLDCDSKYADVMERSLYNGVISGVSLDGTAFFYENPLETNGTHHRKSWFGCACCPPNIARLVASLGEYAYSHNDDDIAVHLYLQGKAAIPVAGQVVTLEQRHVYPWEGRITLLVTPEQSASFGIRLRIPNWCREATLAVNGEVLPLSLEKGYAIIHREWHAGDAITLDLAMPVNRIYSHPRVRANAGRVALQRGPLVYCLEQTDNGAELFALSLPIDSELEARFDPSLLGGVTVLEGRALRRSEEGWDNRLFDTEDKLQQPTTFRAVPYAYWDNRDGGEMLIWMRETL